MLDHVLQFVDKDGNFDSIFLHVQVNNESAISFYQKFGFSIVETKPAYYKRIEPADAHVLQKSLRKINEQINHPVPTANGISNGPTTNSNSNHNNPHQHYNGRAK